MTVALKWTKTNAVPMYQGGEPLPVGVWLSPEPNPVLCERGWHACRWDDLPYHISAELWVVVGGGKIVEGDDKIACEQMMLMERVTAWDERTARLFAADCAERVLPIFEIRHPHDGRPRRAIEAARNYAEGLILLGELTAAWDAAWAAAGVAERDAAGVAAGAVGRAAAWAAAWGAGLAVGRAAAWAAAWTAAGAAKPHAAWAAERRWQADRIGELCGLDRTRFLGGAS